MVTAKHSRGHQGMWRLQTFRKWRSLFISQHAWHCFCAYGIRIRSRLFHWKMNSLSLGIPIPTTVCAEWSDIDTALTAKDAQILFSLERLFFTVAFQRCVKEGHSKFATDSASAALQDESSEAQNRPESDGDNPSPADNHVSNDKQMRTRQKLGNVKRPVRSVPKKQKWVSTYTSERSSLKMISTTAEVISLQ